jgi:hypothetical protein
MKCEAIPPWGGGGVPCPNEASAWWRRSDGDAPVCAHHAAVLRRAGDKVDDLEQLLREHKPS